MPILALILNSQVKPEIKIEIVYPKEGSQVIAAESTFVFGNVSSPEARFWVNGIPTELYHNGAFLAYIPVTPGNFTIKCVAISGSDTARAVRRVCIPHYLVTSSANELIIDTSYVFPQVDCELPPGEQFKLAFKGTPGCQASFSVEGLVSGVPMKELPPRKSFVWGEPLFGEIIHPQMAKVKGIYVGSFTVPSNGAGVARQIRFELKDKNGQAVSASANGKLFIYRPEIPQQVEFIRDVTVERSTMSPGDQLFFLKGTSAMVTGRRGSYSRIKFSDAETAWVKAENVNIIQSTGITAPAMISTIQTELLDRCTRVKIGLDQRLPIKIEQDVKSSGLSVFLYGVASNTDFIQLELDEKSVTELSWEQPAKGVWQLKIKLTQKLLWGYRLFYENGTLFIDIRTGPGRGRSEQLPLKGVAICLDPGHGPDTGAIGPTGLTEREMNYRYCAALKRALETKGAFVIMTRGENFGASITERIQYAIWNDVDLLLSFHFNALPDGVNPFRNHGISCYYYHPQSYRLANLIQKSLTKRTGIRSFGLFYENLAMVRPAQMLAVLIEPGFITHPWEEILIASSAFQERVVAAVVSAIEQFIKESSEN
ncbi:MAG: N-acetylmuramoyl-L-alanine amidase [candidate division KSB1 bacterium]|nr:N-acetylmuramoyl-L-alanine amidase [candidate division KSB1 bacterium]MDZ7335198.1 N-acetylmuramoyl-L-alanine amidase [candidate division KSB1 bacterium]MDZ7356515.1 N-acetylmuramoyl-L-alanine amidase [candidate division KSB1 bacterium]MDZ7400740.1 N-acetylmuramoyl-L-alanine amidase [candidate division KSB1 bacterium]